MVRSVRTRGIVWFIGVMCVVQTLAQQCPYSDPECTCGAEIARCRSLQQIPPLNTGGDVFRVTQLIIQEGNITTIPKSSLPAGLISVELSNNPFTNISDDAFDESAATLQAVVIINAKFNTLPTALTKLPTLTNLTIDNTVIKYWNDPTLKLIAATLKHLELRDVGLSLWPGWISYFHLLHSIDLSFNSLKAIPDDAFSSIKDSLTTLHLSSTGLTEVPEALSRLAILDTLFLNFNNIGKVSEIEKITRFPLAEKLSTLSLLSVGLNKTANFSNLTNLRWLSLDADRISEVPAGSLPTSLTSLFLRDNVLSSVPQDVAKMPQLSHVDLSGNVITGIEPNSFPSSLTYLDLSSNKITTITKSTLRNLNMLRTLSLDDNPISTMSTLAFADLTSLRFLYLTNSHLTEIPAAFAQLSPQAEIRWATTQPLACPCPAPKEQVDWFSSLKINMLKYVMCSNGQSVTSYLTGHCGQTTTTP